MRQRIAIVFAVSLGLAGPALAQAVPTEEKSSMGVAYLVMALVIVGMGAAVNRIAGRPRVNGGAIAVVLLAILVALRVVAAPNGFELGRAIGEAVLGIAIGSAAWRSFAKAKAAAPLTTSGSRTTVAQ